MQGDLEETLILHLACVCDVQSESNRTMKLRTPRSLTKDSTDDIAHQVNDFDAHQGGVYQEVPALVEYRIGLWGPRLILRANDTIVFLADYRIRPSPSPRSDTFPFPSQDVSQSPCPQDETYLLHYAEAPGLPEIIAQINSQHKESPHL